MSRSLDLSGRAWGELLYRKICYQCRTTINVCEINPVRLSPIDWRKFSLIDPSTGSNEPDLAPRTSKRPSATPKNAPCNSSFPSSTRLFTHGNVIRLLSLVRQRRIYAFEDTYCDAVRADAICDIHRPIKSLRNSGASLSAKARIPPQYA
jgi:hypothetical protein